MDKMKKAIYLLMALLLVLASCEPLQEIYDELEDDYKGHASEFKYTLTSDDYAAIADLATNGDAADFIEDYEAFSDEYPAADYLPPFIAEMYPALSEGSAGLITYNYNGEMPEDLAAFTDTDTYTVADDDYESFDGILQVARYFSPGYAPEAYIPDILAANIDSPSEDDLVLVTYEYSTMDPKVDFGGIADVAIWQETFNGTLGVFTAFDITGAQSWTNDDYGDDEYAKMSGYASGAQENEDWLISDAIDLTGISDASFRFREAINYLGGMFEQVAVLVSTDWDGTEAGISTATWDELSGFSRSAGNSWAFVESSKIDFSGYANETIHIAFKYTSTDSNAATWEVDRAEILVPGDEPPVIGLDPETYKTFYMFDGSEWMKASNYYYLNSVDYDAMGDPGRYDNFSSSDAPQDYLPALLDKLYPLAGEGFEAVLVYKYYAGTTLTLADRYTVENGGWVSTYNYFMPVESQFLFSSGNWVFDPTVIFTMTADDYQIIVDYVESNIGASYIDTYGTFEDYSGAGSYYANFDIRSGSFDDTVFDSWEDAVEWAIGVALLPTKFPDAVTQVSGIDVHYRVSFATYSGSDGSYYMEFKCSKAGPNPEFTFVEGPTAN